MFKNSGKSFRDIFGLALQFAIAVLPAIGLQFYTPCPIKEDGTYMHCHDSYIIIITLSVLLVLIGITLIIAAAMRKTLFRKLYIILSIMCVLIAAFAIFHNYSLCMMSTMPCFAMVRQAKVMIPVHAGTLICVTLIERLRTSRRDIND